MSMDLSGKPRLIAPSVDKGGWIPWIREKVGNDLIFVNSAGAWIKDQQGRVLLQRRSGNTEAWGFPGGIMELGESAAQTVVREIKEETGLDVAPTRLVGIYTQFFETCPNGDECQNISFFFEVETLGGDLTVDGHETLDLRYCSADDKPPLYSEQHELMWHDAMAGGATAYR
ncbi:NUDIX domain-containing protein [Parvibaculaceae bacterium PLY_AMNH_Bact1]|nr:NUDIX domain-containing protein [Parvibaculaceae bacterium PLY_AMNH_Bact1]